MYKLQNSIILLIAVTLVIIFINSCDRTDQLTINKNPEIEITSYEGEEDTLAVQEDSLLFQQVIYWNAWDEDGVVKAYAFRIKDKDGNPIETPGYEFLNEDGWIYHYQEGANETIPMNDPEARITIWTKNVHAEINFPANSDGQVANVISSFEVKCIDNRDAESEIAQKFFNATSTAPKTTVLSTKGDINGKNIGRGIVLSFISIDNNNGASDEADHFEFKLIKGYRNEFGEIEYSPGDNYDDIWYSTEDEYDTSEYMLTQDSDPPLLANSEEPIDSTYLFARCVNIAGVISEPDTITFYVKNGFHPGSLIYSGKEQPGNDIWILGENHFVRTRDASIEKIIESQDYADGAHFSTPFWLDKDGRYTAIGSSDLKIFMHWGWHGEYGTQSTDGFAITDNPQQRKINTVVDEQTGEEYFAEIKCFDLRLDGEPFYYPPLPPVGDNLQQDENGKEWLRVPVNHQISQNCILTGLDTGDHVFEVRAVDIQNIGDSSPARMEFTIIDRVPPEEKEGVIILDDDVNHPLFAPDALIDSLYEFYLEDFAEQIEILDREELKATVWDPELHFAKDVFCPTDLEQYKYVIYHSDYLTVPSNIHNETEVLEEYLRGGGNLILSGGLNLRNSIEIAEDNGVLIFEDFYGISNSDDIMIKVITKGGSEATFLNFTYFKYAIVDSNFPEDIYLRIPSFNTLVNSNEALGPVIYFDENLLPANVETLFRFGCVDPGDSSWQPTFAEYDLYNGQPIVIKNETENNRCYLFGFPLSYMDADAVKIAIETIINE